MLLLPRSTSRGDLRSAGITRFFARPSRFTGPHHSRRCHSLPSFYIGQSTRGFPWRSSPKGLSRRSPGYFSVVVWLDAVLDPGEAYTPLTCSSSTDNHCQVAPHHQQAFQEMAGDLQQRQHPHLRHPRPTASSCRNHHHRGPKLSYEGPNRVLKIKHPHRYNADRIFKPVKSPHVRTGVRISLLLCC